MLSVVEGDPPVDGNSVTAAYLGASNEDKEEFYEMFLSAIESSRLKKTNCRMIKTEMSQDDLLFLKTVHIIVIAGGDCKLGNASTSVIY